MAVTVENYIDVQHKCDELNLKFPTKIAIIPRNFSEVLNKQSLLEEGTSVHVRRIWEQVGIVETPFAQDEDTFWAVTQKDTDWIGPTIFIAGSFYTQNPHLVSISLNLISEYVMSLFRITGGISRKSRLDIVLENTKSLVEERKYIKISYEGCPEGIQELSQIIQDILLQEK